MTRRTVTRSGRCPGALALVIVTAGLMLLPAAPAGASYRTGGCRAGDHKLLFTAFYHPSKRSIEWESVLIRATAGARLRVEIRKRNPNRRQWAARGIQSVGQSRTVSIDFASSRRAYMKVTAFFANGTHCAGRVDPAFAQ